MEIMEIITGGVTIIMGLFFLALTFFSWGELELFLQPEEEGMMKIMLLLVAIIGTIFLVSGLDTFINLTG